MTLIDIIELVQQHWGSLVCIVFVLSSVIEVSKIQINPWSKLLECLGNVLFKNIEQDLQEVKINIQNLSKQTEETAKTIDDNEVWRLRYEILAFANSCKNNKQHTKDEFDHILEAHDKYNYIIRKRGIPNGVMDVEHAYVRDLYRQCLENNSFLK